MHGAEVSARETWRGQTALMWAAADNHPAAAHMLVEMGADVDERSNGGWTALLFAVRTGSQKAVVALLEAGANVNDTIRPQTEEPDDADDPASRSKRRDPRAGTSALVIAVANGHFSLARYLVERGANPNAADQGWTALHQLAYTRRPNSGKGMPPVPSLTVWTRWPSAVSPGQRRRPEPAADRAVQQSGAEQLEPNWRNAVSAGRQACRRASDASLGRAWSR